MVSIARGVSVSSSGGVLLPSERSINEDERILCSRNPEDFDCFKPLLTFHIVFLELFIAVGLELTAVLLYFLWPSSYDSCDPFFILIYTHAVFWIVVLIIHNFLRMKHQQLRIRGYIDFYKYIVSSAKIAFYIVSATNTFLLVMVTLFCQHYSNIKEQCENGRFLKPTEYLLGVITVENICFVPFCISYLIKVHKFNQDKPFPDFRKNDWMPHNFQDVGQPLGEIGFRYPEEELNELLKKQADVIQCLRDRNDALCEQIIQLEESIRLD